MGVGQLVADHNQGFFALIRGDGQNVLHRGVSLGRRHGDDALVGLGDAHGVQLAVVGFHHHNALLPGLGCDGAERAVRGAPGNVELVDSRSGAQRLCNGVAPFDQRFSAVLLPLLCPFPGMLRPVLPAAAPVPRGAECLLPFFLFHVLSPVIFSAKRIDCC